MLPAHLSLNTAISLIRERCNVSVTSDWLLQLAHEGKIELLALLREPVYFMAVRDGPVNWTEVFAEIRGKTLTNSPLPPANRDYLERNVTSFKDIPASESGSNGLPPALQAFSDAIFAEPRSSSTNGSNLATESQGVMSPAPPPLLATEGLPVITIMSTSLAEECFAIADYVPLEPAWVGRIFASKASPRATVIPEMLVKGKRTPVFTKSDKGKLCITEDDIFLKRSELERFLQILSGESPYPNTNVLQKNEELGAVIQRIRENKDGPLPLTKQQMGAKPWPLYDVNLEKLLSDPGKWAEPACVFRNSPGSGSSLWNPALFAYCLATTSSFKRPQVKREVLGRFMEKHFPDCVPQWEDLANFI